jgi:hypothetical protein
MSAENKKILFYGASVTAQAGDTGFFELVKKELMELGFEVFRTAYGGCHIDDAGFYRFESALENDFSFIVFEWNTTGLSTYNEFKLAYILQLVKSRGAKPLFLILPQESTVVNKRNSENQILYICRRLNIPLLDVSDGLSLEKFKLLVRDIVHTNELGANFYKEKIVSFIKKVVNEASDYFDGFNLLDDHSIKHLKSNILPYEICLKKEETLKINIKSFSDVYSELLIRHRIGTFSPVISISDGVLKKSLSLWDSYCHYEREHFTTLINNADFKSAYLRDPYLIEIKISDDLPKYETCRRPDVNFDVEKLVKITEIYSIGINFNVTVS